MGHQASGEPARSHRHAVLQGSNTAPSSIAVPTLLLTTPGRRSGVDRTVPLVYVGDGSGYVVANARPAGERINPWVLNLRAAGQARIRRGGRLLEVKAEELDEARVAEWWPALVGAWPVFAEHCAATGDRTVFRLELISQGLGER